MSKPKHRPKHQVAAALALFFVLPFAAGLVRAAETAPPAPIPDKPPPPTIDTNNDGKADAWDRNGDGLPDAWDVNADGLPDLLDDNGDGKPDDKRAPPPPDDGSPE